MSHIISYNSDVSVADQNNLISRSRNPFAGTGERYDQHTLGFGFNRRFDAGFKCFGEVLVLDVGWGFIPSPSRVGSLLLGNNTMTAMLHNSRNIKEAKTKQHRKLAS
eukprot:scaffold36692_cov65-Cyclotella_meneghiniana.AAC.2